MTFCLSLLPLTSPLTCYYPHQHHWPRALFPKDLFLAMFPAPWKHILTSGSYPQRKGQTLSRGTHDPPKNTLTPHKGIASELCNCPTNCNHPAPGSTPGTAHLGELTPHQAGMVGKRGGHCSKPQNFPIWSPNPPCPGAHHYEPQTTSLFPRDRLLSLCQQSPPPLAPGLFTLQICYSRHHGLPHVHSAWQTEARCLPYLKSLPNPDPPA